MNRSITIFCLMLTGIPAFGQTYKSTIAKADSLYRKKEFAPSVAAYKEAFALEQKKPGDLYNAACSAALSGDTALALQWLNQAFQNGWTNVRHLKSDTDLESLHGLPAWEMLTAAMQKEVDRIEANYDKPLQAELLAIFDDDQKYRRQISEVRGKHGNNSPEMQELWKIITEKDSLNLLKIKAILDKHGWVGADKVGGQANQAIFLVIQHADLATQQKYLPMMREAVKNKNAASSALALLEDRVALGEGRKQVYGSQIGRDAGTGLSYVLPLDDPDNVDKRRATVGLGPLADYVRNWNIEWNVEEYKKKLSETEEKAKSSQHE